MGRSRILSQLLRRLKPCPWVAPAVEPFLSETDIWQACVPDAALLLENEADKTITPIEDAAPRCTAKHLR